MTNAHRDLIETAATVDRRHWSARLRPGPRGASVSLVLVLGFAAAVLLAPWITPHDPVAVDLAAIDTGPSPAHLLGTDSVGRDVLSRLLEGGRPTLLVPFLVILIAGVVGTTLALIAAWARGSVDYLIGRALDVIFAFPAILLAIMLTAMLGAGTKTMVIALSIAYVPYVGRIVRSEAVRQRSLPYVAAAEMQGQRASRIVLRHVLPNVAPLLLAQLTLCYGYSLIDAATLSYLGLGVQPPTPDWGSMVAEAQAGLVGGRPQVALYSGAVIVVFVVAVTTLGNRLADLVEDVNGA